MIWLHLSIWHIRWSRRLLWLGAFSGPGIEYFLHKPHPRRWGTCEVVLNGAISESDEIMFLVIRRYGKVLVGIC
jgi:hypothetical protein